MRVKVLSRNPDDYVRETKLDLQRGEQHPRAPRLSPSPDPFSPPAALLRPRGGGSESPGPAWRHREAPGLAAAPGCLPGAPRAPPGAPGAAPSLRRRQNGGRRPRPARGVAALLLAGLLRGGFVFFFSSVVAVTRL